MGKNYIVPTSVSVSKSPRSFFLTIGALGSHSLHLMESGQNIDQLNPSYFSLGLALSQSIVNPLYQNGGVGTLGTPTVSRAQLLLPFPQYASVMLANSDTASSRYYSFYFKAQRHLMPNMVDDGFGNADAARLG